MKTGTSKDIKESAILKLAIQERLYRHQRSSSPRGHTFIGRLEELNIIGSCDSKSPLGEMEGAHTLQYGKHEPDQTNRTTTRDENNKQGPKENGQLGDESSSTLPSKQAQLCKCYVDDTVRLQIFHFVRPCKRA